MSKRVTSATGIAGVESGAGDGQYGDGVETAAEGQG
jgi:hypothetical protein